MNNQYDLIILGGGLAGLTLAIQTKKLEPSLKIAVCERRDGDAPDAAHKVGESTVELGTHYLREVLELKDYLDEHQLPKHGLRFFFSPEHKTEIDKRVELGPRELLPVPSHQIDRGTFENKLAIEAKKNGIDVLLNARVENINFNEDKHHQVTIKIGEHAIDLSGKWVVDATGRAGLLKRKLDLSKPIEHNANAAWFRVKGEIDIDTWSDNKEWNTFLEPGLRRLGTIHLMDKGYWVWLIPLATGNTSIGIVADPEFHPLETYNTIEKAYEWLKVNEPLCYKHLIDNKNEVLDFKSLKHYALHTKQLFSDQRWALTGEAGMFLDPFYSPGTDFIALGNTLIADLVIRDCRGEDICLHATVYEKTLFSIFDNWVPLYQNKYQMWGNTQTMIMKIFWDWAIYWSVPTLLFTNLGFTNVSVLKRIFATEDGAGQKFGKLSVQMQTVLLEWSKHDNEAFQERYIDPFDIEFLKDFHTGIDEKHSSRELVAKVIDNVSVLEEIASEMFRCMSHQIYDTPMDMKVDPYTMSLKEKPSEDENGVITRPSIQKDIQVMWYY